MMTFGELLQQSKDAIVDRWLEAALSVYPEEGSAAFRRQKDPFANPVGHRLRTGTREMFEALLHGADGGKIREHLHEIISIRAVQEVQASRTVGFIFELKDAVRAELGEQGEDPRFASELAGLDGQIDRMALAAFDIFVQCRERVCELRVNEAKRQVSWIVGKMNARGSDLDPAQVDRGVTTSEESDVQREGV